MRRGGMRPLALMAIAAMFAAKIKAKKEEQAKAATGSAAPTSLRSSSYSVNTSREEARRVRQQQRLEAKRAAA